jgi:type II secretory ATPase GspE/PulE/Tfp pilus assembly ATPase PilB-like protein
VVSSRFEKHRHISWRAPDLERCAASLPTRSARVIRSFDKRSMTSLSTGTPAAGLSLPSSVSIDYLAHHGICPKGLTPEGALVVAVAPDALVPEALDDLAFAYGCPVTPEPLAREEVERLIARLANGAVAPGIHALDGSSDAFAGDESVTDVRDQITQPPVIACANRILDEAHEAQASDIHLEATREGLVVRYRIDGVLVPGPALRPELAHPVISRLKLLSNLDWSSPRLMDTSIRPIII